MASDVYTCAHETKFHLTSNNRKYLISPKTDNIYCLQLLVTSLLPFWELSVKFLLKLRRGRERGKSSIYMNFPVVRRCSLSRSRAKESELKFLKRFWYNSEYKWIWNKRFIIRFIRVMFVHYDPFEIMITFPPKPEELKCYFVVLYFEKKECLKTFVWKIISRYDDGDYRIPYFRKKPWSIFVFFQA